PRQVVAAVEIQRLAGGAGPFPLDGRHRRRLAAELLGAGDGEVGGRGRPADNLVDVSPGEVGQGAHLLGTAGLGRTVELDAVRIEEDEVEVRIGAVRENAE